MKTYDAVLAGGGLKVGVFDAQQPGREASWASAGMISPVPESAAMAPLLPISMASVQRYPEFIARVEELSGRKVGYRKEGALDVFLDDEKQNQITQIVEEQRSAG